MKRRKQQKAKVKKMPAHTEVIDREIDNPNWRPDLEGEKGVPRTETQKVNIRESAVETLYARGGLTKLQKRAADMFRAHWETYAREQVKGIDYARDHVDGGTAVAPISASRARARKELVRCRKQIGARNYALLVSVCGQGRTLSDLFPEKSKRIAAAQNLRESLYDAAILWGLASKPVRRRPIATGKTGT